jgi:aspartyl-tRNA(Asn)/glutamyl-tRNA(Gln) amidotransferase subunit C
MLPEKITREMFDKLVSLAALELDEEESEYLRTELNHQLAAVKELSEIPIDEDVQPSLHGIECQGNPPRPDEWQPFPDPDAILALAPEREGRYFVVPEIAQLSEEGQ